MQFVLGRPRRRCLVLASLSTAVCNLIRWCFLWMLSPVACRRSPSTDAKPTNTLSMAGCSSQLNGVQADARSNESPPTSTQSSHIEGRVPAEIIAFQSSWSGQVGPGVVGLRQGEAASKPHDGRWRMSTGIYRCSDPELATRSRPLRRQRNRILWELTLIRTLDLITSDGLAAAVAVVRLHVRIYIYTSIHG